MSEQEKKKEESLRLLSKSQEQADRVEALGREMVESARLFRDVVTPMHDFVAQLPADSLTVEQWDHLNSSADSWSTAADKVVRVSADFAVLRASSYAFTSTSNTVLSFVSDDTTHLAPDAHVMRATLNRVLGRRPLAETALSAMRRLGLDRRRGTKRTPLEFLTEANAALERPVLPEPTPASVLLPLRSCIDETVNELVRRRAEQVPLLKQHPLISIGAQCGRAGVEDGHFERLAVDCRRLGNDLSDAKQTRMSQDRVSELFQEGLAFLNALLDSVDEARLRF